MKSGIGWTWLGNTIFDASTLASCFNLREFDCSTPDLEVSERMFRDFNLEVKIYRMKHGYFCSRFLVSLDGKYTFVADPVRTLVRLGRDNIASQEHLAQYATALIDHTRHYDSMAAREAITEALYERYHTYIPADDLMRELRRCAHHPEVLFEESPLAPRGPPPTNYADY
jgi:hypothetical protein